MKLLEGEKLIAQTQKNTLTLTNYRLRYRSSSSAKASAISMLLTKISSIEITYKSKPLFLILAIALFCFGGYIVFESFNRSYFDKMDLAYVAFGIGLLLFTFFILSRKHILQIKSDGAALIQMHTGGLQRDALDHFIDQIEDAKRMRE